MATVPGTRARVTTVGVPRATLDVPEAGERGPDEGEPRHPSRLPWLELGAVVVLLLLAVAVHRGTMGRQLVEQQPDATLKELRDRLGIVCAESAICMALKRLKLSFKKRRFMRPSRTGPTSRNSGPTGGSGSLRSTAGG